MTDAMVTEDLSAGVRVALLERDVREIKAAALDARKVIRDWTLALIVLIAGSIASGGMAAIAYGRLQERADQTAAAVESLRAEVHALARRAP